MSAFELVFGLMTIITSLTQVHLIITSNVVAA
jgi:hypothetical protein